MTRPRSPDALRKAELARIHIGVAELGWDDDVYRAILLQKTGKNSARDLDAAGRRCVLDHIAACKGERRLTKQQWLIKELWRQLGATGVLTEQGDAALDKFIGAKSGASSLRFVGTAQASPVIEALKSWLQRARRDQANSRAPVTP